MIVRIKKGLNIPIIGKADKVLVEYESDLYAVKPTDFRIFEPKLLVSEGDYVCAGDPVMFNKLNKRIVLSSPVSGKIKAIVRGEKRQIEHVVIEKDSTNKSKQFQVGDFNKLNRDEVIELLLNSGLWPTIRQRPFAIISNPADKPSAIFISGFDLAPLAPDYSFLMEYHSYEYFKIGIKILQKLTSGKINLCVHPSSGIPQVYNELPEILIHHIYGPYPSSNVGVQIHHILPIRKNDLIWYIEPQHVTWIGRLFKDGIYCPEKIYALAGSELKKTYYFKAISGVSVRGLLNDNLLKDIARVISGNVLTGKKIDIDGYVGYYDNMVSVIPEGKYFEFMGWAKPRLNKFSFSRAYFSWLFPKKKYRIDTNLKGEERAFVVTGEYEKVFPMKIMPVQLLKAIITRDFDAMEQLGIYEVAEEDFALCEFACTSKINCQQIVREGIEFVINELKD